MLTLLAKVCKLEMKVDATDFNFDNCLVGGSYVKDFTIRNHSEIPLLFGIKTDTVHHPNLPSDSCVQRSSRIRSFRFTTGLQARTRFSSSLTTTQALQVCHCFLWQVSFVFVHGEQCG